MPNIKQNKTTGFIALICASHLAFMQLAALWNQISSIVAVLRFPEFSNSFVFPLLVSLASAALSLLLFLKILLPWKNHLNTLRVLLALCVAFALLNELAFWVVHGNYLPLPPVILLLLQLIGWHAVLLVCSFLKPPRAWPALISLGIVLLIWLALGDFSFVGVLGIATLAALLILHPVLERPIFPFPREANETEPEEPT